MLAETGSTSPQLEHSPLQVKTDRRYSDRSPRSSCTIGEKASNDAGTNDGKHSWEADTKEQQHDSSYDRNSYFAPPRSRKRSKESGDVCKKRHSREIASKAELEKLYAVVKRQAEEIEQLKSQLRKYVPVSDTNYQVESLLGQEATDPNEPETTDKQFRDGVISPREPPTSEDGATSPRPEPTKSIGEKEYETSEEGEVASRIGYC